MSTLTYHGQFQSHILSTGTGPAAIGISVSDFLRLQNNKNIHVLQLGVIDATFSVKGMYMLWLPKMNKAFESIIPGRWSFFFRWWAICPLSSPRIILQWKLDGKFCPKNGAFTVYRPNTCCSNLMNKCQFCHNWMPRYSTNLQYKSFLCLKHMALQVIFSIKKKLCLTQWRWMPQLIA